MLRTYSLSEALDFILFTFDEEREHQVWNTWLIRKPTKGSGKNQQYMSFDEFKKEAQYKSIRVRAGKSISPEQEKAQLDFAKQFIKVREESSG